jgi:hypothetical protein
VLLPSVSAQKKSVTLNTPEVVDLLFLLNKQPSSLPGRYRIDVRDQTVNVTAQVRHKLHTLPRPFGDPCRCCPLESVTAAACSSTASFGSSAAKATATTATANKPFKLIHKISNYRFRLVNFPINLSTQFLLLWDSGGSTYFEGNNFI